MIAGIVFLTRNPSCVLGLEATEYLLDPLSWELVSKGMNHLQFGQ